jgi:uncharacterized protein
MTKCRMVKSYLLRLSIVIGIATCCLSGCLNMTNTGNLKKKKVLRAQPKNMQLSHKTERKPADPASEIKPLLRQPYIDPLTHYIKLHTGDPSRARQLDLLKKERRLRCELIAREYQKGNKTPDRLKAMSDGYGFSCPEQVELFAKLVTDQANNECYLLTELHNYREASELCREPAENGDARAQLNMAVIYRALGNYESAMHWATLATKHFPEADYLMGQLYAKGQGTEQNDDKAIYWYELAAKKGHTGAQTALGVIYLNGTGVIANPETARYWLLKAARKNDAQAFYHLGKICEQGRDPADLPRAMVWYDLACQKGLQKAQERLLVLSQTAEMSKIPEAKKEVHRLMKVEPR